MLFRSRLSCPGLGGKGNGALAAPVAGPPQGRGDFPSALPSLQAAHSGVLKFGPHRPPASQHVPSIPRDRGPMLSSEGGSPCGRNTHSQPPAARSPGVSLHFPPGAAASSTPSPAARALHPSLVQTWRGPWGRAGGRHGARAWLAAAVTPGPLGAVRGSAGRALRSASRPPSLRPGLPQGCTPGRAGAPLRTGRRGSVKQLTEGSPPLQDRKSTRLNSSH